MTSDLLLRSDLAGLTVDDAGTADLEVVFWVKDEDGPELSFEDTRRWDIELLDKFVDAKVKLDFRDTLLRPLVPVSPIN